MNYVAKVWGKTKPVLADTARFRYPEITTIRPSASGFFQIQEGTGKFDRSKITVRIGNDARRVEKSAAAIKTAIRRVRPEEREAIEDIDRQMAELRERRAEIVKRAWERGHVVTLAEAVADADAALATGGR